MVRIVEDFHILAMLSLAASKIPVCVVTVLKAGGISSIQILRIARLGEGCTDIQIRGKGHKILQAKRLTTFWKTRICGQDYLFDNSVSSNLVK